MPKSFIFRKFIPEKFQFNFKINLYYFSCAIATMQLCFSSLLNKTINQFAFRIFLSKEATALDVCVTLNILKAYLSK